MGKSPQDHKDKLFSFEVDGKSFTFEKSLAVVRSFGWQRKHRSLSELDQVFAIFEEVAGDECLEALDGLDLTGPEFEAIMESLQESVGGSQGE